MITEHERGPDRDPSVQRSDVVFLVADKNVQAMVRGFLTRDAPHLSLGCSAFTFTPGEDLFFAAGQNDPGLYNKAGELTRGFQQTHEHLVVILDAAWEGSPGAEQIEMQVEKDLRRAGWENQRFVVIVIDPELENWVWANEVHVEASLKWERGERGERLREWLAARGLWEVDDRKPNDPKRAVEDALREVREPRSSAIYGDLASKVSLAGCEDGALAKLINRLKEWFPP
jgi:hypothetical protein